MRRLQGLSIIVTVIVTMLQAAAACGGSSDGSGDGSEGSSGSSGGASDVTDRGPIGLEVVGVWKDPDNPGATLTFNADGTVVFDSGGTNTATSRWGWYDEDWYIAIGGTSDGNDTEAMDLNLGYSGGSLKIARDTQAYGDSTGPVHAMVIDGEGGWYKD